MPATFRDFETDGHRAPEDLPLLEARRLVAIGQTGKAHALYVKIMGRDPSNLTALHELGCLSHANGFRSAARTIYHRILQLSPHDLIGHVNLGSLLHEDGELSQAKAHFLAALEMAPDFHDAHRGLARVLGDLGDTSASDRHWRASFDGQAITAQPCRGTGPAICVLLLVSVKGGNIPTGSFLDDRTFSVTTLYVEYYRADLGLPDHDVIFNAIGDAELCSETLDLAEHIVARARVRVVNRPSLVRRTDRVANSSCLSRIPGVRVPATEARRRADIEASRELSFPFLLRSPGFHAGQHFVKVQDRQALRTAMTALPGDTLLHIEYIDARGSDGLARKYRVMCLNGTLFPIHLAASRDWKVHYFTSDMAADARLREEEKHFLTDMTAALGLSAMEALACIANAIGLDYFGVDFAIDRDGSVLVFEANATMVINPPPPDPMWDYRRAAIETALEAARALLRDSAQPTLTGKF